MAAKVWLLRTAYRSRFGTLLRRMTAVGGLSRASALAGNAFVAIVPLLIVVASWTERSDRRHISDALVSHFGLTGGAADAVQQLFARPPEHAEGVTLFGMLLILISERPSPGRFRESTSWRGASRPVAHAACSKESAARSC